MKRYIAIVGSRSLDRRDDVRRSIRTILESLKLAWTGKGGIVVVSGGANGVDKMAKSVARELGIEFVEIVGEWYRWGKRAGPMRNRHIVKIADDLYAFWDGRSRGTKDAYDAAEARGIPRALYTFSDSPSGSGATRSPDASPPPPEH